MVARWLSTGQLLMWGLIAVVVGALGAGVVYGLCQANRRRRR